MCINSTPPRWLSKTLHLSICCCSSPFWQATETHPLETSPTTSLVFMRRKEKKQRKRVGVVFARFWPVSPPVPCVYSEEKASRTLRVPPNCTHTHKHTTCRNTLRPTWHNPALCCTFPRRLKTLLGGEKEKERDSAPRVETFRLSVGKRRTSLTCDGGFSLLPGCDHGRCCRKRKRPRRGEIQAEVITIEPSVFSLSAHELSDVSYAHNYLHLLLAALIKRQGAAGGCRKQQQQQPQSCEGLRSSWVLLQNNTSDQELHPWQVSSIHIKTDKPIILSM